MSEALLQDGSDSLLQDGSQSLLQDDASGDEIDQSDTNSAIGLSLGIEI